MFDVDDGGSAASSTSLSCSATHLGGTTRYKMLETIREYALERLDATGETPQIRKRHAVHYSGFAEQAGAGLKGPQERAWLGRIEDELDNLRAAVMWSLASGDTHLACGCVRALGLQGLRIESVVSAWAESITECAAAHDDPAYPVALAVAAYAKMGEGQPDDAAGCAARHWHASRTRPCRQQSRAVSCRASQQWSLRGGRNPGEHAEQWLSAAEAAGDVYEMAIALNMMAVSQNMAGDPSAYDTAEECLRMARGAEVRAPSHTASLRLPWWTLQLIRPAPSTCSMSRSVLPWRQPTRSPRSSPPVFETRCCSSLGTTKPPLLLTSTPRSRAFQYGRRDQQIPILGGLAACFAARGTPEPAAVIDGWIRSIIGSDGAATGALYTGQLEWIARLPEVLGADRYTALAATGAAMTAAQVLDYAQQHTGAAQSR